MRNGLVRVPTWRALIIAALAASTMLATPALAQLAPPPPVRQSVDANGVDLFRGTFNIDGPALSMGQSQGLSYARLWRNGNWTDTIVAYLYRNSGIVTATFGGTSNSFTDNGDGTFTNTEKNGSTLTLSGMVYTYTSSDGTIAHFSRYETIPPPYYVNEGYVTDVTEPSGDKLTYTYDSTQYCSGILSPQGCTEWTQVSRLASVRNSFGYQFSFSYERALPGPKGQYLAQYLTSTGVTATNLAAGSGASTPSESFDVSSITDAMGRTTQYRISSGQLLGVTLPSHVSEDMTIAYSSGRVASVTTVAGTTLYGAPVDSGGVRTVTVTDPSSHTTTYTFDIASQRMKSMTNALSQTWHWDYDTSGRLTKITAPESNYTQYTLDDRGNIKQTTQVSKTPGTPANIVTSADYPATCTNAVTCNQPDWTKDANGNQTDYTYDSTSGRLLTVTEPAAVTGGIRPTTTYAYTSYQAYYASTVGGAIVASGQPVSLLTGVSRCQTTASCVGTADETKNTTSYGPQTTGVGNNLLPVSITAAAGDGSVSATATTTYDNVGNVLTIDGPLAGTADTTTWRYDLDREVVGVISADPDGAGALKRRAERLTYNDDGQVTEAEAGTVNGTTDADWAAFVSKQQLITAYDAYGRKTSDTMSGGSTTYGVTQYSYDSVGRPDCTAVRMNSALWGTLPSSACTAQTASSYGPDRIVKVATYDALNRATSLTTAYGQSYASTESTVYTDNGKVASVTDGENNKTTYIYDGFDRLSKTEYPSPTKGSGTSSTTDYEELVYDANSNITSRRLRGYASDGTQHIDYGYDHLNRLTTKDLPGSEPDVAYGYDLLSRPTSASQTGNALSFTYDALSRLLTETGPQGTLTSTWDAGGRRTKLAWPDGFYVNYDYDTLGEMTKVRENGATSGVGVLASYAYDDLGDRTGATFGNGTSTTWTPDPVSRLATLAHNLGGSADDLTKTFTYNPANQIASSTGSNDAYAWTGAVNVDRNYTSNGLSQYTASGSTNLGYDARGNLTSSPPNSYTYSSENLLLTGPSSTSLTYDPLLRLYQVVQGSTTTRFAYDGLEMVGEYNGSNALVERYVYGPGIDEPIVQYAGSGTSNRNWLHADERGSVIALTDSSGNPVHINSYDEYGIPAASNIGRFQYTGQAWISELGLYYYKARMYSPSLGRFMQTDPIGYADGLNWYSYVGGDPINLIDPFGLCPLGQHRVRVYVHGKGTVRGEPADINVTGRNYYYQCVADGDAGTPGVGGVPGGSPSRQGGPGTPQNTDHCKLHGDVRQAYFQDRDAAFDLFNDIGQDHEVSFSIYRNNKYGNLETYFNVGGDRSVYPSWERPGLTLLVNGHIHPTPVGFSFPFTYAPPGPSQMDQAASDHLAPATFVLYEKVNGKWRGVCY